MTNKRDSILQAPVPDLGAPRLSYVLVAYDDCDPPEYALGICVNGKRTGLMQDGAGRVITSRSPGILRVEAQTRGIPPEPPAIAGATA